MDEHQQDLPPLFDKFPKDYEAKVKPVSCQCKPQTAPETSHPMDEIVFASLWPISPKTEADEEPVQLSSKSGEKSNLNEIRS